MRVSAFYIQGEAIPFPEFRNTRWVCDVLTILLAQARLALKLLDQEDGLTAPTERGGSISTLQSSSGLSVRTGDTVIAGDQTPEAVS